MTSTITSLSLISVTHLNLMKKEKSLLSSHRLSGWADLHAPPVDRGQPARRVQVRGLWQGLRLRSQVSKKKFYVAVVADFQHKVV